MRGPSTTQHHLLTLPYDIRYLIYQHVFPPGTQIYLQALPNRLMSITPEHPIPTALLQTCKQLNAEASGYLYNRYLFNIVGRKTEVLARYESFNSTLEKYARDEVHIDPFSNGEHSATMCISLHTGSGKMGTIERRARGIATKIQEVKAEVGYLSERNSSWYTILSTTRQRVASWCSIAIFVFSVLVAIVAWFWSGV